MKNIVLGIALITALALGGFSAYQQQQLRQQRAELTRLKKELEMVQLALAEREAADDRIALAEQKARVLQETLSQTTELSASQSKQVSDLEQSLASAKTNNSLASLFNDPEMRDMIKAQQKAVMGPMIERNYAELFKKLGLTPEQASRVKELLEQKMLVAAEKGLSLLADSNPENRKRIGEEIRTDREAADQALKDFLGSDNFKALQDYEKTIPDRMNVAQYKEQFGGLDDAQERQLVELMSRERQNFQWTTDYNNQDPGDPNFAEMFSADRLARFAEEQAAFNRHLVDQARGFMRPDQIASLESFLENQRKMQEAAMRMVPRFLQSQ